MTTKVEKKGLLWSSSYTSSQYIWAFIRLAMGWMFLWAFIDKLFGLGYVTQSDSAWLAGGSPTSGFLQFGTRGPLTPIFQKISGSVLIDTVFMISLLLLGVTLILGIGVKIAGYGGAVLVFLMFLAALPPENNPLLDDHILYVFILLGLTRVKSGQWLGLGNKWAKINLVQKYPILE